MMYSIVMLLHEFYPKLKVEFNDQEARVLFAISRLGKMDFTIREVNEVWASQYGRFLELEQTSG